MMTLKCMTNINNIDSLSNISQNIIQQRKGSYQYNLDGNTYLLNVHYLPDFKWLLLVDTNEDEAIANIRHSLYINIFIGIFIILTIIFLINTSMTSYQWQLKKYLMKLPHQTH
jgi:sensor c-di-GMP phosphodiesterase-like protein